MPGRDLPVKITGAVTFLGNASKTKTLLLIFGGPQNDHYVCGISK